MERRLYFTFPTPAQARRAVAELVANGISRADIHSVARDADSLAELPTATPQQRDDRIWKLEGLYWNLNLVTFFAALVGLLGALYSGHHALAAIAGVVMLITFITGERFAVQIPHAHLAEQQIPLVHGEVVVMVDVPARRVHEVEGMVCRHHPEAGLGGVGWHVHGLNA